MRSPRRAFRVGLYDNIVNPRFSPAALMRAGYLTATAGGADSFWVPDHLNSLLPRSIYDSRRAGAARLVPRIDAYFEPWTTLGYLAAKNRVARIRLGVSVTDAGRRNPAVTAQAAATLNLLTRGRAVLGIGPGEREANEPYGIDWTRPVARFEEALATIRALWNSSGEPITRDSEFFPLRAAVFDLPAYRATWPQIWVAAHGPRMLRAAGRYGDAWFPGFLSRPKDYAQGLAAVHAAACEAGRDPGRIIPAGFLTIVTGASSSDVEEALDSAMVKAWALNAPAHAWSRHGADHPLGPDFAGAQDNMPQQLDAQTAAACAEKAPPSLLREILVTGTSRDVVEQIAEWRNHGMRYVVIANASILQRSLRRGLLSTAPLIKVLRDLRKL